MHGRRRSSWLRIKKLNSSGNITVHIAESQLQQPIQHTHKAAKYMEVPARLTLDGDATKLVGDDGSLATEVLAGWSKRLVFRASPAGGSPPTARDNGVVVDETSCSRAGTFSLPPCYSPGRGASRHKSCIAGLLNIPVPDELDVSTFQSNLLSVSYELELKIVFRPPLDADGPSAITKTKLQCVLL